MQVSTFKSPPIHNLHYSPFLPPSVFFVKSGVYYDDVNMLMTKLNLTKNAIFLPPIQLFIFLKD